MAWNERGQHYCPEPLHTAGGEVNDKGAVLGFSVQEGPHVRRTQFVDMKL